MFEHGPSDRVQLRTRGELLHPGTCALCGNGTHELPYVDPAISYDEYNLVQVYFCQTCVSEMAELIGCIIPAEAEFIIEESKKLAVENATLREELENAKSRLDVYDSAILSVRAVHGINSNDADDVESSEQGESSITSGEGSGHPESINESDVNGSKPKSVAIKSVAKRRSHDSSRSASSNKPESFSI